MIQKIVIKILTFASLVFLLAPKTVFGQQLTIEFSPNPDSSEYESLIVSHLPEFEFGYGEEDAEFTVQYVLSSIKVLSGEWLIERSGELTAEESFATNWFLTVFKNPNDVQGMVEVLDEAYFGTVSERHAEGEFPTEFELTESEMYSDIRLLGVARYGSQHILFADLNPIDQGEASGFVLITGYADGQYRLSGAYDNATVTLLFGFIPLEIHKALRARIGIE